MYNPTVVIVQEPFHRNLHRIAMLFVLVFFASQLAGFIRQVITKTIQYCRLYAGICSSCYPGAAGGVPGPPFNESSGFRYPVLSCWWRCWSLCFLFFFNLCHHPLNILYRCIGYGYFLLGIKLAALYLLLLVAEVINYVWFIECGRRASTSGAAGPVGHSGFKCLSPSSSCVW